MWRMDLPVMPPVAPMLAKAVPAIPPGASYEPKWDGFRSIVFRDGDEVEIGSRNEKPMTRYFPEVVAAVLANFPPRAVVDGEIVIADTGRNTLDFEALQQRIHPAATRIKLLSEQTPASFIAFDLLALDDDDLTGQPLERRRAVLEQAFADARPPIHLTPVTRDLDTARQWFEQFEGAGLDGLIAKPLDLVYQPDKRVMTKIKHVRTADCVVAGYRPHKSSPDVIGSLLLGLYDDEGLLRHVGVAASFGARRHDEIAAEVMPRLAPLEGHPWEQGFLEGPNPAGRLAGAAGRWTPDMELDWNPIGPLLVCEVAYDQVDAHRFRHPARFRRWRPDRDPHSCTLDQLDVHAPRPADVLAGA
jgi:ATP-dependent DNA ligase